MITRELQSEFIKRHSELMKTLKNPHSTASEVKLAIAKVDEVLERVKQELEEVN